MKPLFKIQALLAVLLMSIVIVGGVAFTTKTDAATSNPSTGSPAYQLLYIPVSGVTVSTNNVAKVKVPWPLRIVYMSASGNTVTGAVTVDMVNSSGTSLLVSALTLSTTANIVSDASVTTGSTANITDETAFSFNTAGTGTVTNLMITIGTKRL
jgi:hypothetical protein